MKLITNFSENLVSTKSYKSTVYTQPVASRQPLKILNSK